MLQLRSPALLALSTLPLAAHWCALAEVPAEVLAGDDECNESGRTCTLNALQHSSSRARAVLTEGTKVERYEVQEGMEEAKEASSREDANRTLSMQKRLTIRNGCHNAPIWIAHIVAGGVGPSPQDVKIPPHGSEVFFTALGEQGLSATRFWPKMGCNARGNNCSIGDSGGPGEGCVIRRPGHGDDYSRCHPPVDSKFEATFAPPNSQRLDTVDMSLVDGYSLPFKLEVHGSCTRHGVPFDRMDCGGLTPARCPKAERFTSLGKTLDLRAVDPRTGKQTGCFSPCMRLVDDKWNTPVGAPHAPGVADYCCAGSMGTPQACKAGPIEHTQYVQEMHKFCPAGYGYAFDDVRATVVCSTRTTYELTFYCPA